MDRFGVAYGPPVKLKIRPGRFSAVISQIHVFHFLLFKMKVWSRSKRIKMISTCQLHFEFVTSTGGLKKLTSWATFTQNVTPKSTFSSKTHVIWSPQISPCRFPHSVWSPASVVLSLGRSLTFLCRPPGSARACRRRRVQQKSDVYSPCFLTVSEAEAAGSKNVMVIIAKVKKLILYGSFNGRDLPLPPQIDVVTQS